MSRRAITSINWAAIAEKIPESEKHALAAFKARSDQFLRRMSANPEVAPKIDWAYYKKNVATASLVDKFQKEYESLSIPYPVDKYTSQIEAEEKEMMAEIQKYVAEMNEEIEEAEMMMEDIEDSILPTEMTMEEQCEEEGLFDPENPTIWPHTPECQPENMEKVKDEDDGH